MQIKATIYYVKDLIVSVLGYSIRQCKRADCALRYPIVGGHPYGLSCPKCGSETREILSKELVPESRSTALKSATTIAGVMLDNVRSAWNVGSIFRSADGLGLHRLYLCGITPTPDNHKVAKTALGTEKTVSWSHHNDGVSKATKLINQGMHLWALEKNEESIPIQTALGDRFDEPIVLVVGNEICGIDPSILALCERTTHIPMIGVKRSFNVAVAFGIALYAIFTANDYQNI